jgi:acetyltransferase-like isoleucine patch superfamily enzyme
LSLKTVIFNFKYFEPKIALKFPVLLSRNVQIKQLKGSICIKGDIKPGMITIGFSDVGIFDFKRSKAIWNVTGKVIFKGRALIGQGSKISIEDSGELIFGENLKITAETSIVSLNKIEFGKNCLLSWDILIMDDDFHAIINKEDSTYFPKSKPIFVGDNVWIGCKTTILKGSYIPDHCIIGSNSTVNKKLEESNCLYAGNPLKARKKNVDWEF